MFAARQRSLSLVDPEMLQACRARPLNLAPESLGSERLRLRVEHEAAAALAPARPVSRSEIRIPRPDAPGDLRCVVYRPERPRSDAPVFLWLHGGGYVVGTADQDAPLLQRISEQAQVTVVAVDYRLAPEFPYPVPLMDCHAAYAWLQHHATEIGGHGEVIVGGDSAGGGLVAALCFLLRDRSEPLPGMQILIYPMLDDYVDVALNSYAGEFSWTESQNRAAWLAYRGRAQVPEGQRDYSVPARIADLSGLPPAFIAVGALDLFIEQDLQHAARLMRAGVPAELQVHPGAVHGYLAWSDTALGDQLQHSIIERLISFRPGQQRAPAHRPAAAADGSLGPLPQIAARATAQPRGG